MLRNVPYIYTILYFYYTLLSIAVFIYILLEVLVIYISQCLFVEKVKIYIASYYT